MRVVEETEGMCVANVAGAHFSHVAGVPTARQKLSSPCDENKADALGVSPKG